MKNKLTEILNSLNKEEFIDYYINHNIIETAKHYKLSKDRITQICKEIGFKKDKKQISEQIRKTKELNYNNLKNLYISNKQKSNETKIKKYGSLENALKTKIEKYRNTISQKDNHFSKILNSINKEEFIDLYINQNKSRTYMKDKYNLSNYMLDKIINYFKCNKDRKESNKLSLTTKFNKYGGKENYFKSITKKQINTLVNNYGSLKEAYRQRSLKCKETKISKYGIPNPYNVEKFKQTCLDKYGVEYTCLRKETRLKGNNSKPNKLFEQLLKDNNIKFEREFILEDKSFDFKIDNNLIEINPSFTHNSTIGIYKNPPINKDYHLNKTKLANKYNYRCIHIWDWDDKEKIIQSLLERQIIYARKCIIKELSDIETNNFLNKYHFQNTCKNQQVRLGLYYNNELIQVMTFGKPRYNKNYQYELLRLCTKFKYKVVGGSKKLFNYFIKTYIPKSIISYCDNSKFIGNVYNELTFKLKSYGVPTRHWYNIRKQIHITDNLLRQRGFDQLFGNIFGTYGKGTSNEQLMLENHFIEIYDSGQSVYVYSN